MTNVIDRLGTARRHEAVAVWPHRVVCGVDGTAHGREAVRQAAELSGANGRLELVTVTPGSGRPDFLPIPATALPEAERIARAAGAVARSRTREAASPSEGLIRAARGADLLVVGCDALGWVPTAALRRAPCSVLLARRPADPKPRETILLADGEPPLVHARAAELARARGSELTRVRPEALVSAATALGAGLIVTGDGRATAHLARIAPCSVLVVREPH